MTTSVAQIGRARWPGSWSNTVSLIFALLLSLGSAASVEETYHRYEALEPVRTFPGTAAEKEPAADEIRARTAGGQEFRIRVTETADSRLLIEELRNSNFLQYPLTEEQLIETESKIIDTYQSIRAARGLPRLAHSLRLEEPSGGAPTVAEGAGSDFWRQRLRELRACVQTRGSDFLQCHVIHDLMFVLSQDILQSQYTWLSEHRPQVISSRRVVESMVGNPPLAFLPPPVPGGQTIRSSCNLIHHVYSLERFESTTGASVANMDLIVEFGGGYGSFARVAWQRGFRGSYVIHDLAPFSSLQRFYLESLGIPCRNLSEWQARRRSNDLSSRKGVWFTSDLEDLKALQLGDEVTSEASTPSSASSMFVAMFSISEVPYEYRDLTLATGVANFSNFLFWYQPSWHDIPNNPWFLKFAFEQRHDLAWHTFEGYGATAGLDPVTGRPRGRNRFMAGSSLGAGAPLL